MARKPSVADTLESLEQSLVSSFEERLVAIVHYGKLIDADLSDVFSADVKIKVLIVVRDLDIACWKRVSNAFDQLRGRASVVPILLSEKELRSSTDVFPILFLEMKRSYRVLYGEDQLKGIEIRRDHLRLRCEQELKILQRNMQSTCLMHFASPQRLRTALVRNYESFSSVMIAAVRLCEPSIETETDLIHIATQRFGLELDTLDDVKTLTENSGNADPEMVSKLYIAMMAAVKVAAEFVDQLTVDDKLL